MSDRERVIHVETAIDDGVVDVFMDGESGTWRLCIESAGTYLGNVDMSLSDLSALYGQMTAALVAIEADPERFNAELRARALTEWLAESGSGPEWSK